jgi:(S)-2-hydroxyglutarate dehydrogenase
MCATPANSVTSAGGAVMLRTSVTWVRESAAHARVRATTGVWTFDYPIVCAGLTGDSLARKLGRPGDLQIAPLRGEYCELRPQARHRVRGMVYALPDPRYPFLGVHLTRDVRDHVHVGPNAVVALALQGYRW